MSRHVLQLPDQCCSENIWIFQHSDITKSEHSTYYTILKNAISVKVGKIYLMRHSYISHHCPAKYVLLNISDYWLKEQCKYFTKKVSPLQAGLCFLSLTEQTEVAS